jgi:hypothetical protein
LIARYGISVEPAVSLVVIDFDLHDRTDLDLLLQGDVISSIRQLFIALTISSSP